MASKFAGAFDDLVPAPSSIASAFDDLIPVAEAPKPLPVGEGLMMRARSGIGQAVGGAQQMLGEQFERYVGPSRNLIGDVINVTQGIDPTIPDNENPALRQAREGVAGFADQGAAVAEQARFESKEAQQGITAPESFADAFGNPGNALRYYGGLMAESAPMMAAAMATRNPAVATTLMGAGTAGQTYGAERADGATPLEAAQQAVMSGGMESALGLGPFEKAMGAGSLPRRMLTAGATEAATEGITGGGQQIASDAMKGKDTSRADINRAVIDSTIVGGGMGAGMAVLGSGRSDAAAENTGPRGGLMSDAIQRQAFRDFEGQLNDALTPTARPAPRTPAEAGANAAEDALQQARARQPAPAPAAAPLDAPLGDIPAESTADLDAAIDAMLAPTTTTETATEPDLGSVSDAPFLQIGDMGLAGEVTQGHVPPEDWAKLKAMGFVQRARSEPDEDGETYEYEYVPAASLWAERERRAESARSKRAQKSDAERLDARNAGIEKRASIFDRLASEQESLGELGDQDKIAEYRAKAASLRESKNNPLETAADGRPGTPAPIPASPVVGSSGTVDPAAAAPDPAAGAVGDAALETGRRPFLTPDDVAREKFTARATEAGLSPEQIAQMTPDTLADDVTGFFDGRLKGVKSGTILRAQEHVEATGEPAFYVDGDIVNLGGLNKAAGENMEAANAHYRAMTDILRAELESTGGDIVPLRTGGDEVGAVVVNAPEPAIRAAMTAANAKVRAYAQANGFGDIPHTKADRTDRGVGLHLGLAPIQPGASLSDIIEASSAEIAASKGGTPDVNGSQTERLGPVAPVGPAGSVGGSVATEAQGAGGQDAARLGEAPSAQGDAQGVRAAPQVTPADQFGPGFDPLPNAEADFAPVGSWVDGPGPDSNSPTGRILYQVRDVPIADLDMPELVDGDIAPEKRSFMPEYERRAASGEQPPNIVVTERYDGTLKVSDGTRRTIAAMRAGKDTIRALVSPSFSESRPAPPPSARPAPKGRSTLRAIAKTIGLDLADFKRHGVDPANFRGSKGSMPGLFRKQGGMTLSRFREWAQENEYLPRDPENAPPTVSDDDALDLFYRMFANEEAVALGDVDANLQAKAEQDRKRAEDRLNADPAAAMQRERARAIGNQPAIEALADFDNGLLTAPGLQKRLDDAETYDESAVPFSRTDKPKGIALNILSRVVRSLFSGWTNAPTVRAVQSVADVPADVRERARLQTAYHGTPHRGIEQTGFSLQKIGTGEGAQAFGWGLYFAGKKGIAEHYRKALTERDAQWTDEMLAQLPEALSRTESAELGALGQKMRRDGNLPEAQMDRWRYLKNISRTYDEAVERLRPKGALYQVEVPEDSDLLDYDKPLSKHTQHVRDALKKAYIARGMPLDENGEPAFFARDPKGQQLYASLGGINGERAASHALFEAGVPGMRYLDATSRDADAIRIRPVNSNGATRYEVNPGWKMPNGQRVFDTQAEAEAWADTFRSFNYVIWDEAAIRDVKPLFSRESEGTPEGFFDPQTETVWLIADAISTPARARWVAYHEVTGHYGIRGVVERIGKGAGSLRKAFAATRSNPTIDKLARAIAFDRGLSDAEQNVATEEALAELSAAEETGDWQHLADRYNVTVPASMRPGIRGAIDRFVQSIKRLFSIIAEGRTDAFTDADWRELVAGARRYVRKKPEPKAEPENFDVDIEFDVDVDGETVKATGNAQRMLDLAQKRIDNLTRLAECIAA